jgi:transmembrane sensor
MEKNRIDDLFREKINQNNDLPKNVKWTSFSGWEEFQKQDARKNQFPKKIWIYASSAAVVFIVILFLVKYNSRPSELITITNKTGNPKEVKLPCGNSVWLNKESSVDFYSKTDTEQCQIAIHGEAFIEIRKLKSKAYIIKSQNAIIKSENSASFNIRDYPDEPSIEVTINSGAVKVMQENNDEGLSLLVTKGNYCSVHKSNELVFATLNQNPNFMAWKTGKFTFNETPMETVAEVLAQYYGTEIELIDNNIAYCKFSGNFEVQNMDLILNQIKSDLKLEMKHAGKKITFSGQGCL